MEEMKHSHEHHEHHHEVMTHHDCSCSTEEHEHQGCGCHHHHHHEEGGLKSKLFLIGATIILLIIAVFIEKELRPGYLAVAPRLSHSLFINRTRDAGRSCRRYCQGRYV